MLCAERRCECGAVISYECVMHMCAALGDSCAVSECIPAGPLLEANEQLSVVHASLSSHVNTEGSQFPVETLQ